MTTLEDLEAANQRLSREIVNHKIFRDKVSEVHTQLSMAIPGTVVLVCGTAGAGATRVARTAMQLYRADIRPLTPYTALELSAQAPTYGRFHWKSLFEAGLTALDEPVVGQQRRAAESRQGITEYKIVATFRGQDECRTDFLNALHRRSCRVLAITHAHHLLRRLQPEELHHPLLVFHDIASRRWQTPSVVLLSGSHQLQETVRNDSRVDISTMVIDVPVYGDRMDEELAKHYLEMVAGFQKVIGDVIPKNLLVENIGELSERTIGNPGWLKRSLADALADVKNSGKAHQLRWSDIKKRLPSLRARERMLAELKTASDWHSSQNKSSAAPLPPRPQNPPSSPGPKRVGVRNPARDPVGLPA